MKAYKMCRREDINGVISYVSSTNDANKTNYEIGKTTKRKRNQGYFCCFKTYEDVLKYIRIYDWAFHQIIFEVEIRKGRFQDIDHVYKTKHRAKCTFRDTMFFLEFPTGTILASTVKLLRIVPIRYYKEN